MKHVIVYRTLPKEILSVLQKEYNITYLPEIEKENQQFLKSLKSAHALFGAGMKITKDIINHAENLKVISNFSAGYDNLDLKLLTERKIIATNAPNMLVDTVADLIFSHILTTARRVVELDSYIRNKSWTGKIGERQFGTDVHHKNIGIIGLGRIGKKIAKRAQGFDMNIYYHKRSRDIESENNLKVTFCENLDDLLKISDFICIAAPLTPKTKHMISTKEFKMMKNTAILVNGSRGEILDEEALIKALKNKDILGAGLDVFEKEPLEVFNELINLNNTVLTPHIGSSTLKTRELMIREGMDNLKSALNNQRPKNILNPQVFNF